MKTTQIPNMALHCSIEGNQIRGRPRKQWIDNVKHDLDEKNIKMAEALEMVRDRREWRRFTQPHRRSSVDSWWKGEKKEKKKKKKKNIIIL